MERKYYLGIDGGTNSVGYAVTNESYDLLKFHGEPMWGVTTFDETSLAEDCRTNRTARRRLDRRQQRVELLTELFAPVICENDPYFFIRRKESALFAEDTQHGVKIFHGGITDQEYHKMYPTIHHLILDLITADTPRDVRLVYLACAWLVANRGHFLFEADMTNVSDFNVPYSALAEYLTQDCGCSMPWDSSIQANTVQDIMQAEVGVKKKSAMFTALVYGGKKPSAKADEEFPFNRDCIVTLLSGGKAAPKALFFNDAYSDIDSFSLAMDEDSFDRIMTQLGGDGALPRILRRMYDCALLNTTLQGYALISAAKVSVYEQHAKDLKWLKAFIRKYKPEKYSAVFRKAEKGNYVAYSQNIKNLDSKTPLKRANREDFSDYLKNIVKGIDVAPADREQYDDMLIRLDQQTFLPKQKTPDNRVIPQQLYRYELELLLSRSANYLPLLNKKDGDGLTVKEKILSIFDFKIPYYVGPLNSTSPHAWIVRKSGRIYPWNFDKMVDLDISEQRFIQRMTNTCTYLPGEDVLPRCSLLYSRFTVLNELNNLKINQQNIPVHIKQEIYTDLFVQSSRKVTKASIEKYLKKRGLLNPNDELTGVDAALNGNLRSYHNFCRMLTDGVLNESQVEEIICHAAYSEDKRRLDNWLINCFPDLSQEDRKYILHLNLKEFGRLSGMLLTGIAGCSTKGNGEMMSIMDALWQTNDNLMQLLSERYTFRQQIEAFSQEYYADPKNKKSLSDRLSDMYVSNAVKRPIIRTLDIVSDVVKATGTAPAKIFVEMAKGAAPDQKGKRTVTRKQQILDLYKQIKHEDLPRLKQELENMGEMANNRLQSDRLFLYYMQLGRCMYTGEPISLNRIASKTYDIDHIYPKSKVYDDSVLNNKVLVLSKVNGDKTDRYPVDAPIREKMGCFWALLKEKGLITDEKYHRLTRSTGFTEDELRGFINRQLVETRQSTKVVAQLLKERYPDTEIVYVKAGLVSQFRQKFDMLKCRSVNDLHHAKDAYLNIVVGNVYYEKFTRRWFDTSQKYSLSVEGIFTNPQAPYGNPVWQGEADLAKVRKVMGKNAVHITRFAFCRKGSLFDQMPVRAAKGLTPRKTNLPAEKYGGYRKPTASYYLLTSFEISGKREVMFVPVELQYVHRIEEDDSSLHSYLSDTISTLNGNKQIDHVRVLLDKRKIKTQAMISIDGMDMILSGKTGARLQLRPFSPLILDADMERYVKRLESFNSKVSAKAGVILESSHDKITNKDNLALYQILKWKCKNTVFSKCPGNIAEILDSGENAFAALTLLEQVDCLLHILSWFNDVGGGCDLKLIGGAAASGTKRPSMKLSSWANTYSDVRLIDRSASGLFESRSENLLDLI